MRIRSSCLVLLVSLAYWSFPAFSAQTKPAAPATVVPAVDPIHKAVEEANRYYAAGKYEDAVRVYQNAIKTVEKMIGPMARFNQAILLSNLGTVHFAQKKFPESEQAYKQAIQVHKQLLKNHAASVAGTLQHYSALLRRTGRTAEADKWQTQADYLLVGNITGSNPLVEPSDYTDTAGASPQIASAASLASASGAPSTNSSNSSSIINIVQMSASDRALMDNPTTVEKPVYRQEFYWEGGNQIGGTVVRKSRQVLDHYEQVPIADTKSALSYPSAVADLERRYRLSNSSVRTLVDTINSGGSVFELTNNWLVATDDTADPMVWHSGAKVDITRTPEGQYTLTTDNGVHLLARRIATKQ